MTIEIKKPLMNGKGQRCVGLAGYRVNWEGPVTLVKILYRLKTGENKGAEIYPNKFRIKSTKIFNYPKQTLPGPVEVYWVPIEDMEEVVKV